MIVQQNDRSLFARLILITSLAAIVAPGCAHFRIDKNAYKEVKTVAIVESMGVLGEDASAPVDLDRLKDLSAPSPWHRIVTNDTMALRDFLTEQGFTVVTIEEMVQSDKYQNKGEHIPNDYFSPQGMRRFVAKSRGVELGFMMANTLVETLGVDAVICVHQKWDNEGMLDKVAKTTVAISMVNKRSNNIWTDVDEATSAKPIATAGGLNSVDTTEFIDAYNEAFESALTKMKTKIATALNEG